MTDQPDEIVVNMYAVCIRHLEDAILWALDRKYPMRARLVHNDPLMHCHCKRPADYLIREVRPR